MKLTPFCILAVLMLARVHALDEAALSSAASKFSGASPDDSYKLRTEINRLIDEAAAPGKDRAVLAKAALAVLGSDTTPVEAKKYLLRALARVAGSESVAAVQAVFEGNDAMLREEARQVLQSIRDPKVAASLEAALKNASDKAVRLPLIQSLGVQKSPTSIALLLPLLLNADLETAGAAAAAIGRIGGNDAVTALNKAISSGKLNPLVKVDAERSLVAAMPTLSASLLSGMLTNTSEAVQYAAFRSLAAGNSNEGKAAISAALKGENAGLRQLAIIQALDGGDTALHAEIAQAFATLSPSDRLVVLGRANQLKPASLAETVALAGLASDSELEKISALKALGGIGTQAAFEALLKAQDLKGPELQQAAAIGLSKNPFEKADSGLAVMMKRGSPEQQMAAIKAAQVRRIEGGNEMLIQMIKDNKAPMAAEALKAIYFTATDKDLEALRAAASSVSDENAAKRIEAICSRIEDSFTAGDEGGGKKRGKKN